MLSPKSVIPECNIDSCLFNTLLGFEKEGVNHTKGNATVAKKMEGRFVNLFCIGVIDKDKRDLKYLTDNFERLVNADVEEYFRLHKHKSRHHYIIQLVPVIETWICNIAEQLDINIRDFGINAQSPKELLHITKSVSSKNDVRFVGLFKEFQNKATEINFVPLLKLKTVTKLILEKNYNLDINELTNG